jgi:hypothetical protein
VAKISRVVGTTSLICEIFVQDATSTTGAGKTGLLFNTAGLTCFYKRNTANASVSVSLVTATLGTFASGGFKEVDATNMPGVYEFDPPNAALAAGADSVTFFFVGASGMAPLPLEIELTAVNNQDATRFGLSALPNGPMMFKKNQALVGFAFVMVNQSGVAVTGLTVAVTRSIDGGAFANATNTPATEIGTTGVYQINLSAADVNGNSIMFVCDGGGSALKRYIQVVTQP